MHFNMHFNPHISNCCDIYTFRSMSIEIGLLKNCNFKPYFYPQTPLQGSQTSVLTRYLIFYRLWRHCGDLFIGIELLGNQVSAASGQLLTSAVTAKENNLKLGLNVMILLPSVLRIYRITCFFSFLFLTKTLYTCAKRVNKPM